MRNSMLVSVAALALLAGAGVASAQTLGATQPGSAQMKQDTPQQSGHPADTGKGGAGTVQPGEQPTGRSGSAQRAPGGSPGQAQSQTGSQGSAQTKQDSAQQSGHPADTSKGGPDTPQPSGTAQQRGGNQGGSPSAAQSQSGSANTSASLTTEQRSKIRETIVSQKVQPEKNLSIQVSVGAIVPKTVKIHPLPAPIVQIQPAWRGYMFFLVGDEIVIVEPGSLRVVAVLPA